MSSNEQPRTPSPVPKREADVNADGASEIAKSSGMPPHLNDSPVKPAGLMSISRKVIEAGPDASSKDLDVDFLTEHLRPCPEKSYLKLQANPMVANYTEQIMNAPEEFAMYQPMAELLTLLSKTIHKSIPKGDKQRLSLQSERPIVFLDHHSCTITRFPVGDPKEFPDIVGVFQPRDMKTLKVHNDGTYREVPYHRIETVVEAKVRGKQAEGRRQASSYIHHILQARPDRPSYYGMSATQDSFQLYYGSPLGLRAAAHIPWTDLKTLCAYVYSLYDPPDGHVLYDRTIIWSEPPNQPNSPAMWNLTVDGEKYYGARIVFLGYPFGRRTTVFRITRLNLPPVIIKEFYLESGRRYEEVDLLAHIHLEGYVPGVVRVFASETVESDDAVVVFREAATEETRTKQRIVFGDFGMDLEYAKTVNDLLKAVYDVLEMHRTVASRREVLHRDMSIFNIMMYPQRSPSKGVKWMEDVPPLIDAVLAGQLSDSEIPPIPCGLMIDYDHSALLGHVKAAPRIHEAIRRELKHRTGTPAYIARAVTIASFPCGLEHIYYLQMPSLRGKAKDLYVQAYGRERYDKYTDDPTAGTYHGGLPRRASWRELQELAFTLPFYHRWEYDAESVFWTMYSVLLRVLPQNAVESPDTADSLELAWEKLKTHKIPETPRQVTNYDDVRQPILGYRKDKFIGAFLPVMQDVASMLQLIAEQVSPTYALMDPPPPFDDHLHEAIQRLILQYLVDHQDTPIPLTPGVLRSVDPKLKKDGRELGTYGSHLYDSVETGTGSKRPREEHESSKRRVQPKRGVTNDFTSPREDDARILKGLWNNEVRDD
ncbi:hypothetical protein C8Q73DRAFT_786017 [Cubamyces lactineus]|nr:hypothetical protein C8Q73DRAFT_786017 [Cubamyces lactineus]